MAKATTSDSTDETVVEATPEVETPEVETPEVETPETPETPEAPKPIVANEKSLCASCKHFAGGSCEIFQRHVAARDRTAYPQAEDVVMADCPPGYEPLT